MWCIVRSRTVGFDADDVLTLAPVGPFSTLEDAHTWLERHGYGFARADTDDYWRSAEDPYATAEVCEMEGPADA